MDNKNHKKIKMESIDIEQKKRDVSMILARESHSYETTKDALTSYMEKEGPCRMRFAVLARSFSHESRLGSLRWYDFEATAIAKEKKPDPYGNKHAYNMLISFATGIAPRDITVNTTYTIQPLKVHMTRKEKGSKTFVFSSVETISVQENGKSIGDVVRWYITTDYPEDHPIFAAMKNFNAPMDRYQHHRAQAKLAQIEFEDNYIRCAEEVLQAVQEQSSKRQKID